MSLRIGVPGFLGGKRGMRAENVIGLTTLGKSKAEQFSLQGPEEEVIADLNDSGPSALSEIADRIRMPESKVKSIARSLIRRGYARKVSSDEG